MKQSLKRVFFIFRLHKSVPFVYRFFTSKLVSFKKKFLFLAVIGAYVLLPLDLIHDYLPLIGIVDDVTLIALLLDVMRKQLPELEPRK